MGDTLEATGGQPVTFRAWTNGGMDRRLWIICDGLPLAVIPLDRPEAEHVFSLDVSGRSYVRAELRGFRGRPERGEVVWAMTNPIWLRGQWTDDSGQWTATISERRLHRAAEPRHLREGIWRGANARARPPSPPARRFVP